ncbi:MAG TPA: DUF2520 domain-containing protein [Candidatus Dormibacteraeota bacterium]|nr:DUF2520 domain-containing protein [Candidatus Dormibacteraeota bacterium]
MTETEVGYGIVGAGRLAQAVARRLAQAGVPPGLISSRSAERAQALATELGWEVGRGPEEVLAGSRLTLLCAPDGLLGPLAEGLGSGRPLGARVVAHCAGIQGIGPLAPLRERGCALGVFHPLAPFPDGDPASFDHTFISIEAEPGARTDLLELARLLGCRVLEMEGVDRPLYHAAAVFAAVLPVLLERIAERLGRAAGGGADLAEALRALHVASARNVHRLGPELGLSGPQQRHDGGTVLAHLAALSEVDPALAQLYASIQEAARPAPADRTGTGD